MKAFDEIDGIDETYYKFGYSSLDSCLSGLSTIREANIAGLRLSLQKKQSEGLDCVAEALIMLVNFQRKLELTLDNQYDEEWYELKTRVEYKGKSYIQRGSLYHPDGTKEINYHLIRDATKFYTHFY